MTEFSRTLPCPEAGLPESEPLSDPTDSVLPAGLGRVSVNGGVDEPSSFAERDGAAEPLSDSTTALRAESSGSSPAVEEPSGNGAQESLAPAPNAKVNATSSAESAQLDTYGHYLNQIKRYPLLTKEQEVELAQTIETGVAARKRLQEAGDDMPQTLQAEEEALAQAGDQAKRDFMLSNLRLAVSIAKRHQRSGARLDLMDLIQEGNLGLERAVDKFEWRKGFKFSIYASLWIRQAITKSIDARDSTIKLPAKKRDKIRAVRKTEEELTKELGHQPSDEAVAGLLGWTLEDLDSIKSHREVLSTSSLDAPIGAESDDLSLGSTVADPDSDRMYAAVEADMLFKSALPLKQLLSAEEREVLSLVFGFTEDSQPLSQKDVASRLGISSDQAGRIRKVALSKLRRYLQDNGVNSPEDFLTEH